MPVYTVDKPGFRAMIQALNSRYQYGTAQFKLHEHTHVQ